PPAGGSPGCTLWSPGRQWPARDKLRGLMSEVALDKSASTIRDMFAGVAPRYDLLNRVLSGWLDVLWRRRATRALGIGDGHPVLDLCCGTGDQAIALQKRGVAVTAADFCVPMLALARRKYAHLAGDAPAGLAADAPPLPAPPP